MSAMGSQVRSRMTQRAFFQEDTATGNDAYGNPVPPVWTAKAGQPVPCFAWVQSREESVREETTVVVQETKCIVPLSAGITEQNRLDRIEDRLGFTLWAGPMNVRAVSNKHNHIEMHLEE